MDLAFFYLMYKKLRSQQLWKYCDKCCNTFSKYLFSVVYINISKKKKHKPIIERKKKTLGTVATVPVE